MGCGEGGERQCRFLTSKAVDLCRFWRRVAVGIRDVAGEKEREVVRRESRLLQSPLDILRDEMVRNPRDLELGVRPTKKRLSIREAAEGSGSASYGRARTGTVGSKCKTHFVIVRLEAMGFVIGLVGLVAVALALAGIGASWVGWSGCAIALFGSVWQSPQVVSGAGEARDAQRCDQPTPRERYGACSGSSDSGARRARNARLGARQDATAASAPRRIGREVGAPTSPITTPRCCTLHSRRGVPAGRAGNPVVTGRLQSSAAAVSIDAFGSATDRLWRDVASAVDERDDGDDF